MVTVALFLDLRILGTISALVPYNLSTGCWMLLDRENSFNNCENRTADDTMNKDVGIIELDRTVEANADDVPSNAVAGNFNRAVTAVVQDSRHQWTNLQNKIESIHGDVKKYIQPGLLFTCRFGGNRMTGQTRMHV